MFVVTDSERSKMGIVSPHKMGRAKKRFFLFHRKKRNCLQRTRDFQADEKKLCLQTKMERRNKKILCKHSNTPRLMQ